MQVAIAHSVVTAPAHAAAIEKWSSAETCCFGIIGGKAPFIDRRHEPLCFRGGIRLLSPQVDTHELPLLCGAVPADPWCVCVSLSLSGPHAEPRTRTPLLAGSSLLERGERKKGRERNRKRKNEGNLAAGREKEEKRGREKGRRRRN